MGKILLADALKLSVAERIQLVEDIWDSITESPQSLSLTEAQQAELDRRLEDYRQNPNDAISWDSLKTLLSKS